MKYAVLKLASSTLALFTVAGCAPVEGEKPVVCDVKPTGKYYRYDQETCQAQAPVRATVVSGVVETPRQDPDFGQGEEY